METGVPTPDEVSKSDSSAAGDNYGPVRRTRIPTQAGPLSLFRSLLRSTPTKHDDFVEILNDVLPQLLDEATGVQD